jgi:hypothetical protein
MFKMNLEKNIDSKKRNDISHIITIIEPGLFEKKFRDKHFKQRKMIKRDQKEKE